LADQALSDWQETQTKLVKVIPRDYKRMLEAFHDVEAAGLSGDEAVMAAFDLNIRDLSRVSGN
jgi:glutamate synthase (NADPH/NADH) large chain